MEMRVLFLGCTAFSEKILKSIIDVPNVKVVGILSIPEEFSISYSESKVKNVNYASLEKYAESLEVPYHLVDSGQGKGLLSYRSNIKSLEVDVILVMGWYYMVPKSIRNLAKLGAWGIHASLLPNYAGGAPLVWAMIEGQKSSGVTLFRLDDGVDDGDIIAQREFTIEGDDTIKEVYDKATEASCDILRDLFSAGQQISFKPQDRSAIEVYPQRNPEDGEIDWSKSPKEIHNFIRAQTHPYPGAWFKVDNKKVTIWSASIEEL